MILRKEEGSLLEVASICAEFRSVNVEEGVSVEM